VSSVVACARVEETDALGRRIATVLEPGDLLSLEGPLGAGKTTLVRGIAGGLGVDPAAVRSPTFVLHHVYTGGRMTLHHLDLYRLGEGASTDLLDLDGLLDGDVVAVEWGELADLERWRPVRIGAEIAEQRGRVFSLLAEAPARLRAAWPAEG